MCSIMGQASSCLNFMILDENDCNYEIEDEDLIIKMVIKHTNKI